MVTWKYPIPYEDLLRVTLAVARGPGIAARVVAGFVSTLDLAPTFYDVAGCRSARGAGRFQGSCRRCAETRDVACQKVTRPSVAPRRRLHRTVRTRTHKCTSISSLASFATFHRSGGDDHRNDPH